MTQERALIGFAGFVGSNRPEDADIFADLYARLVAGRGAGGG